MGSHQIPAMENDLSLNNRGKLSCWVRHSELDVVPGDLLEIDCGRYRHWAIYDGPSADSQSSEDPMVVHFDNRNPDDQINKKQKAQILRQSLSHVVGKNKVRINNSYDNSLWLEPAKDSSVINRNIQHFINEGKPYYLMTQNCEHFATFCRYGVKISDQARVGWIIMIYFFVDAAIGRGDAPSVIWLRNLAEKFGVEIVAGVVLLVCIALVLGTKYIACLTEQRHEINTVIGAIVAIFAAIRTHVFMTQLNFGIYAAVTRYIASSVAVLSAAFVVCLGYYAYQLGVKCGLCKNQRSNVFLGVAYIADVFGFHTFDALLLTAYVENDLRLMCAAYKDWLNLVAYAIFLAYLIFVFGFADAASLFGLTFALIVVFRIVWPKTGL